jgi:superfamily II DNA or RNA helicase
VNLFIADDVGLGKTIEAGLIARELLMRKKARDIVVCCPPSVLLQWQEELENRFGLRVEILDRDYIQRVRRERGFGVNPWTTHSRFLVSQRLLIDEAYAGPLRDWLGSFRSGSLLILDEAHHAAPSGGQRYSIDSHITKAVRDLAPRFEHRLFLSATPHNGHSNSFSALLELLDRQRFCRGVKVTKKLRDEVIVRRLKEDLRQVSGGFPKRNVEQLDIEGLPADAPELRLAALLDEYRRLREQRLSGDTAKAQAASGLVICCLQQRLLSSIEAFSRTLRVHRKTVQRQWQAAATSKPRTVGSSELLKGGVDRDDERAQLREEELQAEEEAQLTALSESAAGVVGDATARAIFEQEQKLLDEMTELAESSRALPDAKIRELADWIHHNMCPGGQWNNRRVIIFTGWDDTKRFIVQQLNGIIAGTDRASERIAVFHGPTSAEEREEIKNAFNSPPDTHPLRILVATDAAREGINLQAHCQHLFHFDVPWNPSRMEQRNGRIDRKLQEAPEVFCYYFFYKQRPEDRILAALVRKSKTIIKELGSFSPVVEERLDSLLQQGISRKNVAKLESDIDAADLDAEQKTAIAEELEDTRAQAELKRQLDSLRNLLEQSRRSIGLEEEQFRAAISSALQLIEAEPLKPAATDSGPPRFVFPAVDRRAGGDSSWVGTMDALRPPKPRDQSRFDWRREAPIRPVVFEDPGRVTDEVVQLHLEHPVVQRLLARFTAQGFVLHDLSRACLAHSHDAIPRVALIGRLALYGPGAARLHEDLIWVTARWIEPQIRKGPLAPYKRDAESLTKTLLDNALLASHGKAVPDMVAQKLTAAAPNDVRELLPHLQQRAEEFARDAREMLRARAEAEANQMQEILETQRKHIEQTAERHDHRVDQLALFPEDERRQAESNRRYWTQRLEALKGEIQTEPERIRALYDVKAQRIEPVGLVYLWPITG